MALLSVVYVGAKDTEIYVIPGGDSIGLQLSTGIYITGKYDVKTAKGDVSPWENGNLEVGDKMVSINNIEVSKIEDVQKILSSLENEQDLILKIKRGNKILITSCRAVRDKGGKFTLGLYVKDEVLGIGTVTYIDPKTKKFGALGHSMINDSLNGDNIGLISASSVRGIRKSFPGVPGEKQATLGKQTVGTISKNIDIGVFGKIKNLNDFPEEKAIKVASPNEVRLGKAQMLTVLENNKKESFDVEIVEVKNQSRKDVKGIKIKITDEELLEKTGGIIQGMSGSPIIQDNKLIGAVSHVIIDSPDFGYCVYAMWMVNSF
ncbi:MAG: SpoIVB peptidase [Bacilli bacterium]|nr:SpoIVB peptidase [Bacilli bacterium]